MTTNFLKVLVYHSFDDDESRENKSHSKIMFQSNISSFSVIIRAVLFASFDKIEFCPVS